MESNLTRRKRKASNQRLRRKTCPTYDLFSECVVTLRSFIPNDANIVEPLRKLTQKEQKWLWGDKQTKAFEALKESLSLEPVLVCFHLDAPTFVVTDASPVGLGAILLQDQGTGQGKPIAYISRSLLPTERRYSQIECEVLGCVWAVERLHNYLFGVKFTLLTDNKPLSSMFDPHSSKVLPPRIQHLAWRLHQCDFRIAHISGNTNTADSLLRLPSKCDDHSKITYGLFALQIYQIWKLSLFQK